MNPYDRAAVDAVWRRVRGDDTDLLENALSEAIADEHRAQKNYAAMARCSGNSMFRQLAAQEYAHLRKLSALYDLLCGCRACRPQEKCVYIGNLSQAVRESYAAELAAAKKYEELARKYPDHGAVFCAIAANERTHACRLRAFAESMVR